MAPAKCAYEPPACSQLVLKQENKARVVGLMGTDGSWTAGDQMGTSSSCADNPHATLFRVVCESDAQEFCEQ